MIDQHGSLTEKFLKKGFWLYLFSFIIAPMGYIVKIIISGELTVSEVGILYGVISLITMLAAYNDLGMTDSLNYFIPKFVTEKRYDKVKSILIYAFIAQMTTGIFIALFFFFGADFIANNYFKSSEAIGVLKMFALYFLGVNFFQICATFFMVIQNTFYNKLITFFRILFSLLITLFVFYGDFGSLVHFSYGWIIGLYLGLLIAIFLFYKKYYIPYLKNEKIIWSKELFKPIFKYAITIYIGMQAGVILSQIDMQMIIYLLGTTSAGYYTNYLSIVTIPFMIIGPIFGLLYPIFSEMHAKGETEKIKLVKSLFQKNFLAIGIAFNILLFVLAKIIAYTLFGEKFIASGIILQFSVLFLVFNFLLQMNFNVMAGIGKVKERVKIVFIAVFFNVIANYLLIHKLGVNGAALATGMGWVLIYTLSEIYLGKIYRVSYQYMFIFKNIFFMGGLGYVLHIYSQNIFEGLGRGPSFGVLVIIGFIWFGLFGLLNLQQFKLFIREFKKIRKTS